MRKKLLYILAAIFLSLLLSQCTTGRSRSRDRTPPPPPTGTKATDQRCYRNGNLSTAQRSGRYPFSKAEKVIFIAFEAASGATPVQNGRLDLQQVKAIKVLDQKQVNALTDLIFNYNYSKSNQLISNTEPGCYIPRNAILFADTAARIFGYIELCFECSQYKSSEAQVSLGVSCEDKLDLLKKLFKTAGIPTTFTPPEASVPLLKPLPDRQK